MAKWLAAFYVNFMQICIHQTAMCFSLILSIIVHPNPIPNLCQYVH